MCQKTEQSASPFLTLLISSLTSSRDIPKGKFFADCSLMEAKAARAFSLVISASGDEISKGMRRSLITALAKTLMAVDMFIKLRSSLREFGFVNPLIIDNTSEE